MGLVIGAAGLGNTIGIGLGSVLRRVKPAVTVVVALLADADRGGGGGGLLRADPGDRARPDRRAWPRRWASSSLDATIQRDVPERHRTSAFARSETLLQLSWVVGGFIGIALPLKIGDTVLPELGLGVLAGLMVAWTAFVLVKRPAATAHQRRPRPSRPLQPGQSSSSSARPRSSLAVGLAVLRLGVAAVAVGLLDALEQPDQVLDDADHVLGLLALRGAAVLRHRRRGVEHLHLVGLVALAAGEDAELDPGAGLERR